MESQVPNNFRWCLRIDIRFVSVCNADKDPWPTVHDNSLSALGAAELTRRIVMHREIASSQQFPGSTWADVQVRGDIVED
jgi:hypothetical protein